MRTLLISPILWRVIGGFAVGTVLTLGLSVEQDAPQVPQGAALEFVS